MHLADHADTIERESPDGLTPVLVFSALKYIKANYKDGTLEAFCETVHQKAYTISRLIKQHTSHTFKELLMEQKLSQAAYLLAKTDLPTESIFHSVGYENSSFFYRKFKEAYGMSPRGISRCKTKRTVGILSKRIFPTHCLLLCAIEAGDLLDSVELSDFSVFF